MARETIKEYLVALGFENDDGGLSDIKTALADLKSIVNAFGEILGKASEETRAFIANLTGQSNAADSTADAMRSAANSAQAYGNQIDNAGNSAGRFSASTDDAGRSAKDAGKKVAEAAKQVDKLDKEADEASKSTDKLADKLEGVKRASEIVQAVLASAVVVGIVSFAKSLYQQNQELSETAKALGKTTEEARAYNTVLRAMGKTAEEIKNSKALTETYKEMEALALSMQLPEASEGVGIIKEMTDSFLKLKVIGSYACQWLYQAVQQVAYGPLRRFKDIIDELSGALKTNLPNWSNGFAKVIEVVLRLASAFVKAAVDIVKFIGKIPAPIKAVGGALLALWAIMKAGPLGWVALAITAILLLLDDFYTYLEGGDSLFGDFWGQLILWIEKAQPYITAVGEWLVEAFNTGQEAVMWVIGEIQSLWEELNNNGTIQNLKEGFVSAFNAISSVVSVVVGWVKSLFKTTGDGESKAVSAWNSIKSAISGVLSIVSTLFSWIAKLFEKILSLESVKKFIVGVLNTIWGVASGLWEFVSGIFTAISLLLKGDLSGAWQALKESCVDAYDRIIGGLKSLWEGLTALWADIQVLFAPVADWFSEKFAAAKQGIEDAWSTVVGFFAGIWESISTDPTLSGIADVLLAPFKLGWTYIETIWNAVVAFFTGIWDLINGDASLADVLTSISQPFIDGWAKIEEIFSGVTEFFSGVWSSITGAFADAATWFSDTFGGAWSQITGSFEGIDIGAWFKDNVWTHITGAFGDVKTWFSDMAGNIWDGLTGGLSEGVEAAKEKVSGFFSNVWDGVLDFFGIHSPSTLAKEASGNVMDGFVGGAEENQESAGSRLKSVFSGIWDSAKSVWDGVTGWLGNLFGWSDEDESAKETATSNASNAASEVSGAVQSAFDGVDASISEPIATGCATATESLTNLQTSAETSASATVTAFTGIDSTIGNIFKNMSTLCQQAVVQFTAKTKTIPNEVKSAWTKAANYTKTAYAPIAPWIANQVSKIKASLKSIPRKISVSVSATGAYSEGGVVDRETKATIGEGNKREYVIPVTKPSRAIPLMKAAMRDLGMTPETYSRANKMLGGSPTQNVTPTYAQNQNTTNNNVTQEINAPSTFHIHGTDAKSIATNVEMKQEQHVRNLKGAFACG